MHPLLSIFDSTFSQRLAGKGHHPAHRIHRALVFILLHAVCLGVLWVGWSPVAVGVAVFLYVIRMFAVTGFYHRYFSHRTFKTSRPAQFVFALMGNSCAQRGPLWWAAHHRHHHRHSDQPEDVHSPLQHSFYMAHMGWITEPENQATNLALVSDLARYPELRFLNRYDMLVPFGLGALMLLAGWFLGSRFPGLGTDGPQMLIWFFISTVVLFHGTCTINSLAHRMGSRRYRTGDGSRNSLFLALITLGEGWHNNHHHYPGAVRQGFYRSEIDITYYGLKFLEKLGIIWDLNRVPARILREGLEVR